MTLQDVLNQSLKDQQAGRLAQAEAGFRRVLAARPDFAGALYNLALVLNRQQKWDDAVRLGRRLLALHPDSLEARHALATSLYCIGQFDAAEAVLARALALGPENGQTHIHLGNVQFARGKWDAAATAFRRAIAVEPSDPVAHINLAATLSKMGDLDGAVAAGRAALALRPDSVEAQNMLAFNLYSQGRFAEAVAGYKRALELDGGFAAAHWNLGSLLLLLGDYERGWPEYEWRWKLAELGLPKAAPGMPIWEGEDLEGKRLVLLPEQGMGDTMQFARYVPELARRGAKVVVACQEALVRVMSKVEGVEAAVTGNQPLAKPDYQCSMPSLPARLKTTVATIPARTPYLFAEADLQEGWRRRLAAEPRRKVGLVWAGRPEHFGDRERSIPLPLLAPLGTISGVAYFSLQKGAAANQARDGPLELVDWTDELKDFADTAALVANLDLVITVDTAVAHLAGGMGKATWVLLPLVPDWRWMLDRHDSPWYPSVRLFRQRQGGDWPGVISAAASALRTFLA